MAIKSLFFVESRKSPSSWGLCPQISSVMHLSCISLFSTGSKLDNFCGKKIYFWFKPPPFSKILVALLVAFTATDGFFKRLYGPHAKRAKKRCWPYASLFGKHEYEIVKIGHNL